MELDDTIDILFIILTATVGILGNILIIVAIIYDKNLRILSNIFIGSIAIADILLLVTANPIMVISIQNAGNNLSETFCQVGGAVAISSSGVSITTLGVLAINRYMYICNKKLYNRYFNSLVKSMGIGIAVWIYVLVGAITPNFTGWTRIYYAHKQHICSFDQGYSISYTILMSTVGIGFPSAVTFMSYMKTFLVIRKSSKSVQSHKVDPTLSGNSTVANKNARQFKQILVFLFVSILFVGFWTPYAICLILDINDSVPMWLMRMVTRIANSNSCINCIIYGVMNKHFRNAYQKIIFFWRKRDVTVVSNDIKTHSIQNAVELNKDVHTPHC